MKDWIKRHIGLTRQEHVIISVILLLMLSLIWLRQCANDSVNIRPESGQTQRAP